MSCVIFCQVGRLVVYLLCCEPYTSFSIAWKLPNERKLLSYYTYLCERM